MRRGACGPALAGLLATALLCPQAGQAATVEARAPGATYKDVARQRVEVQRLQQAVAAKESDSQAAAEKLKQQDAEIAELRRQLQAAQRAGQAAGKGR